MTDAIFNRCNATSRIMIWHIGERYVLLPHMPRPTPQLTPALQPTTQGSVVIVRAVNPTTYITLINLHEQTIKLCILYSLHIGSNLLTRV